MLGILLKSHLETSREVPYFRMQSYKPFRAAAKILSSFWYQETYANSSGGESLLTFSPRVISLGARGKRYVTYESVDAVSLLYFL